MFYNRQAILRTASTVVIMAVLSTNVTVNAATLNPGLKAPIGKVESVSKSFSDIAGQISDPILDWRSPTHVIEFDLSNANWTTALSTVLSVDPIGRVNTTTPIYVRLNNGERIRLKTKGQGFDARIKLDPSELRETGNKLSIYLGAPSGEQCFLPQHGQWSVDMDASTLKVRSRAKNQNYVINDLRDRLTNPILRPKNIGLIAKGSNASKHQALLAQSIGLHMDEAPDFKTTRFSNELDFVIGQHADIKGLVKNKKALEKSGPRVFVDTGRPLRVFLTGRSEEDVERAVRAFAQYQLPQIGSAYIDSGLLSLQPRLMSRDTVVTQSRTRLSEIGALDFSKSWKPGESQVAFDVKYPSTAQGEILLKLNTPNSLINTQSHLALHLNGQPLGQTYLDEKRKSVSFAVPKGILKGQNNLLSLKPNVKNTQITNCSQLAYQDNALYIEHGSKLTLAKSEKPPAGDVSHMMATGAPFSDLSGKDTLLVLPKDTESYHVALSMLAKFSQTSGQSWSNAEFTRETNSIERLAKDKNILFLTPSHQLPKGLKNSAPKTLKLALSGRSSQGANLLDKGIQQYASNNILDRLEDTSSSFSSMGRITQGGIAALYESPFDKNKVVGVITNTPQQSFKRSINYLKQPNHWNAIEGSVARWTKNSVLMTDLSLDLPNFIQSSPDLNFTNMVKYKFNEIKASALDYTYFEWPIFDVPKPELPKFEWPQLELPKFKWPEFDSTRVKLPQFNFESFREKFAQNDKPSELELRRIELDDMLDTSSVGTAPQAERIPFKTTTDIENAPNTVQQTQPFRGPSFLDQALVKTDQKKTVDMALKSSSPVTDENLIAKPHSNTFKTGFETRVNSLKEKWGSWYRDLPLFTDNTSTQSEYKGTDQTFSLLMLLMVLSLGGLLISLGFAGKKQK